MSQPPRPALAFSLVHGVLVIAHGKAPPEDENWDRLVALGIQHYLATGSGCALVTSEGGAPTAAQRHRFDLRARESIAQRRGEMHGRIAIMSHSPFVRAVVQVSTLFEDNWFVRKMRGGESSRVYRAFLPSEIAQAIAWLRVPAGKESVIQTELERLKKEVAS